MTAGTLTGLITYLNFVTMRQFSPHVVLEELYYLPLFFGVTRFGLKGSILTWLFISATYLPFFFGNWTTSFPELVDRYLHLLFTMVFASFAYILAERERKKHSQAERERHLAGIGQVATVIVHDLKSTNIDSTEKILDHLGLLRGKSKSLVCQHLQKNVWKPSLNLSMMAGLNIRSLSSMCTI